MILSFYNQPFFRTITYLIFFSLLTSSILSQVKPNMMSKDNLEKEKISFEENNFSVYQLHQQMLKIEPENEIINFKASLSQEKKCNITPLAALIYGSLLGALTGLVMTSIHEEESFWP